MYAYVYPKIWTTEGYVMLLNTQQVGGYFGVSLFFWKGGNLVKGICKNNERLGGGYSGELKKNPKGYFRVFR